MHGWHWVSLRLGALTQGRHVLKLKPREDGALIDQFLLSTRSRPNLSGETPLSSQPRHPTTAATLRRFRLPRVGLMLQLERSVLPGAAAAGAKVVLLRNGESLDTVRLELESTTGLDLEGERIQN